MDPYLGEWETASGTLTFSTSGPVMRGVLKRPDANGVPVVVRRYAFAQRLLEGGVLHGAWAYADNDGGDEATVELSADGKSFTGVQRRLGLQTETWTGRRKQAGNTPPVGGSSGGPDTVTVPAALFDRYAGDWDFQSSTVRFLRNGAGASLQIINKRDGRVLYTMPVAPSPDGASLDGVDTGLLGPGGVRFRLILNAAGTEVDASQLLGDGGAGDRLWVATREGGTSTPTQPQPQPQPQAESPSQPGPAAPAGFKPLRRFDVRLDPVWEARGYPTRQVHAFVTIRNISAQPQYITSGFLKAVLSDSDGIAQERNQVWRASAEPAALFNSTPVVQPGAELKIRYVFNPDEGAQPATFTLGEGAATAEFPAQAR